MVDQLKGYKQKIVENNFAPSAFVFYFSIALVSAGIELIFFLVLGMMCFVFTMRIMLITC